MNINDLTIGEAKQLASLFSSTQTSNLTDELVEKYVIVRSRNEGINAGFIERLDDTGIVLKQARRIWYHRPENKNMCWYEGVAVSGLSSDSKISAPVELKAIIEDYSVTICTDEAIKSISGHKSHEQS
jgi:hypothetical protein